MSNPYLICFEILVLILFFICFRHAWRIGQERVLQLIAGTLFGVLLELATIWQLNAYSYGKFLVMVSEVPLAVGAGWGVIIYSARLFSDATNLPAWVRSALDGLLALNIDLAMDAVAIRLGMWDWGLGLEFQYFGVPYANFWAWFWVVVSFSGSLRWLTACLKDEWRWLASPGAILFGVAAVIGTNAFIVYLVPRSLYEATIALTLGSALGLVLWHRPWLTGKPVPPLTSFWVPFCFHLYFLTAGLLSGVILDSPILLAVSLIMFAISLIIHLRLPITAESADG